MVNRVNLQYFATMAPLHAPWQPREAVSVGIGDNSYFKNIRVIVGENFQKFSKNLRNLRNFCTNFILSFFVLVAGAILGIFLLLLICFEVLARCCGAR